MGLFANYDNYTGGNGSNLLVALGNMGLSVHGGMVIDHMFAPAIISKALIIPDFANHFNEIVASRHLFMVYHHAIFGIRCPM